MPPASGTTATPPERPGDLTHSSAMSFETVAASIVGLAAALAALGYLAQRAWRFIVLSVRAFETIVGTDDRPGLATRLDRIERRVGEVSQTVADVQESARAATAAAGLAVSEARAGREVLEAADKRNRSSIARAQRAADNVRKRMDARDRAAEQTELAYVRALKRLGIDLTDVTKQLDPEEPE